MIKPQLARKQVQKKIQIFDGDSGTFTFAKLQGACMAAMKDVPFEYRSTILFEVEKEEVSHRYDPKDYVSANFNLIYSVPETDEELAERQEKLDKMSDEREKRDLAEFERLQKQFGK